MPSQSSEYHARAARLSRAGEGLLETLQNPDLDQSLSISDLEAAASIQHSADSHLRFTAAPGDTNASPDSAPDTALAGLLLDLQSANLLMSAGIALNEHGAGADSSYLQQSISQIDSTRSSLNKNDGRLRFAPPEAPSTDLKAAAVLFHDNADRALNAITDGTASVIGSVIENLKKLDAAKVIEAIDNLGKSFAIVAAAGRLIRQGVEKLKAVLDAISRLFGSQAIEQVKKQVKSLWEKVEKGEYTKEAVRWVVGTDGASQRVAEIIKLPGLELARLDGVSRELAFLDDDFRTHLAVVKALLAGVTVAASVFALFHGIAPWLPLATAGAYLSLLVAALIIGMGATGQRPLVKWGNGVYTLIEKTVPS